MKKIIKYSFLLSVLLTFHTSCDQDFDEINTSKTGATAIDPVFQLNNAIINTSFPGATLIYEIGIVQQVISPNSGVLTGANYNQDNRGSTEDLWQVYYRNVIRNTRDIISRTEDVPERSNLMNMARIFQAYAFMVLTDTYGDVPYVEGGGGYINQVFFPVYDAQENIYPAIIQELGEASTALDPSGRIETADILYGGDVAKWKKFSNSIRLRAGMRLSKVDATEAAQVVSSAFQAGVITSNADNAVMRHDANYLNPIGNTLNSTEAANFYLTEPFVDYLKSTNDPRLESIAVRYVGAKSGPEQVPAIASFDPTDQVGMPMGHDNGTIVAVAANKGLASFYDFSQVDRRRMVKTSAPMFFVTAAQTQLLLAEAKHNGWITTATTTAEFYNNGVKAHMEQLASYDAAAAVPAQAITDYLAANPLVAGTELEQINTQYWVASFLNGPEAWANFRRSGFPDLAPNPFPGKDISGDFIRRLTYPNSEISVNSDNVNAAISRMGADNLDTRVWWDQ
ncbi:MAG: SusD/RagB family nutrient-binding outer membrane lipoprotein [Cyclobacteriaceae bacterium]